MYEIVIVLLLLVSIAIVALILVQQGKGAGMGASFGAGASNTVFGAAGSGNFLTRSTWILALVFFGLCLLIGYLQKQDTNKAGDFTNIGEAAQVEESPADVPSLGGDVPLLPPTDTEVPTLESTDVPAMENTDAPAVENTDTVAAENAQAEDNASAEAQEGESVVNDDTVATDEEVKEAVESSNNEEPEPEAKAEAEATDAQ